MPSFHLIPWISTTAVLILIDGVTSAFALTNLSIEIDSSNKLSQDYLYWQTAILLAICCKGGIVWASNIYLLNMLIRQVTWNAQHD